MTIYNILSSYLSKATGKFWVKLCNSIHCCQQALMRSNGKQYLGTLQNFSSILVYKGNELQKIQEDGNKLTEELAVEKEQLEIQNNKALSFQRSFHDSFENVLKKQRC
jgi:hypothetical protein